MVAWFGGEYAATRKSRQDLLPEPVAPAALSRVDYLLAIRRSAANWPAVLGRVMARRLVSVHTSMCFRTRGGSWLLAQARDRGWWSIVEVLAADSYHLGRLPPDSLATCVDVGANLGGFSVAVAERFPRAQILAFEASPRVCDRLRRNILRSGLDRRVEVQWRAVMGSGAPREVVLWDDSRDSAQNTVLAPSVRTPHPRSTAVSVPSISLEEVLAHARSSVDLLKVDVEGAEYEIFGTTDPRALAGVSRAVVEYHPVQGHSPLELAATLARAGLQCVRHESIPDCKGLGVMWFERRHGARNARSS